LPGALKAAHVRVASREKAIRLRVARILLYRKEQFRHSLVEALGEKERLPHDRHHGADAGTRAKAQRSFEMGNGGVDLSRPAPENAADVPSTGKIRVERQRPISQSDHGADILAEIGQRECGIRQRVGITARSLQSTPGEIDALQPVSLGIVATTV